MAKEIQSEFDIADYDIWQRWRTRPQRQFLVCVGEPLGLLVQKFNVL